MRRSDDLRDADTSVPEQVQRDPPTRLDDLVGLRRWALPEREAEAAKDPHVHSARSGDSPHQRGGRSRSSASVGTVAVVGTSPAELWRWVQEVNRF
jgi:hypothetical protein